MSNLPWGAEYDHNAPWNEHANAELDFECVVEQSLKRVLTITTSTYDIEVEKNEDGFVDTYIDTDLVDWEKEYYNNGHLPLTKLFDELAKYVEKDLSNPDIDNARKRFLKRVMADCKGWEMYDIEVCPTPKA